MDIHDYDELLKPEMVSSVPQELRLMISIELDVHLTQLCMRNRELFQNATSNFNLCLSYMHRLFISHLAQHS